MPGLVSENDGEVSSLHALLMLTLVAGGAEVPPDGGRPNVPHGPPLEVHFVGNKLLPDEMYRAVLALPPISEARESTAAAIQKKLEDFLQKSGFELATVSAAVQPPNAIEVTIDEGQLREIFYRGPANLATLRFELALRIPFDVFNRPELDRQIEELTHELGLGRVWYRLVRAPEVEQKGPQVTNLGSLAALAGHEVHPQAPYELEIFFGEREWDTGSRLDLRSSNVDGLEVIGSWQAQSSWFTDDRSRAEASGGLGLRRQISDGDYYPTFSRAFAQGLYYFPAWWFRPLVDARAELVSRQRPDLGLENYYNVFADLLASGEYDLGRKQTVIGVGGRYQDLWGETPWYAGLTQAQFLLGPLTPPQLMLKGTTCPMVLAQAKACVPAMALTPIRALRPFVELHFNILLGGADDELDRRSNLEADGSHAIDRRSELEVVAHEFLPVNEPEFGEARASWQRVLSFGWHDLWLKARGAYLWGDVPFDFEEPVNAHTRNVFSDIFVDKLVSQSTELRFSISRDLFKVDFFNDAALFGSITKRQLDAADDTEALAVADCFGPGLSALFEGIIEVDVYYAVGWTTATNAPIAGVPSPPTFPHFDNGFSLELHNVF